MRIGGEMKNWYKNISKGQKKFIYFVSLCLVLAYGIGLLPLAILIYLELGKKGEDTYDELGKKDEDTYER